MRKFSIIGFTIILIIKLCLDKLFKFYQIGNHVLIPLLNCFITGKDFFILVFEKWVFECVLETFKRKKI